MIIDGFLYAFGAISDDLKQHFQCPEWAVSLVISLACSCYLVSGKTKTELVDKKRKMFYSSAPLASALCNRFGCQIVGFIGGIVASFSVALSIFSPNIQTMWILFGFIGGIGMGLVYLPSLIMIGYYFEKKRAVATGNLFYLLYHYFEKHLRSLEVFSLTKVMKIFKIVIKINRSPYQMIDS